MKKYIKFSILSLLFSFVFITTVYATDAQPGINGSGTIESGKTFNVDLFANNISGASIMSAGGSVATSNSSCVQFVSLSVPNGEGIANKNIFAWSYMSGKTGSAKVATATFKAVGNNCSSSISFNSLEFSFTDGTKLNKGATSKNINVVTYSTNNNLSGITLSTGNLEPGFNAGQTSYKVNVGSDVTSINIGATAADSKATISGTGNKNLNYGSNQVKITVKAENGSTKDYIINIYREDNRATDANLKSLEVKNGTLSPGFSAGTTEYSVSVPFSVSKLDVNAIAADSKSKVSINNPNLVAEGTTNVTIKVTAENGASKTYVIKVTRGKDPNKKLSNDNNLIKLECNIGILSPAFDKDKTNYFIYLPYEIEDIKFSYELSDKTYAKADVNGPNKLKPDSANKYTIAITAEDESVKTYSITVYRAKNPEEFGDVHGIEGTSAPLLKNLTLKNGKLTKKFDSKITTYEYTRNKDFNYEYELEDENTYINVIEQGNDIYFILESQTGDINVYCLHEKKNNFSFVILIIIIMLLIILVLALLMKMKKILDDDKKNNKNKKKK